MLGRRDFAPGFQRKGGGQRRRQLRGRVDPGAPLRKKRPFVVIGIVDQSVSRVVVRLPRRQRTFGALCEQPRRAFDGGVDLKEFGGERVAVRGGQGVFEPLRRFCFLRPRLVPIRTAQRVEAAREKGAGRGIGDAAARPQHGMGSCQFMGRRAQVHCGVVEDEVFEMDEFAGKPQAGAGVMKMGAGAKAVADRVFREPLVEAREGVLGPGDRDEEFRVAEASREGIFCSHANH